MIESTRPGPSHAHMHNGSGRLAPPTVKEVKIKCVANGQVNVLYVPRQLKLKHLEHAVRDACKLADFEVITIKWMDDEGDPCTISYQDELNEALRLHEIQKDSELIIHVFLGQPSAPGAPCPGEDRHVYRRGARRWKKFYRVNGHRFQAKRFNRKAQCLLCAESIWGLGRQGYRCVDCRIAVHKRCHRAITVQCNPQAVALFETAQTQKLRAAADTPPSDEKRGVDNPIFDENSTEVQIDRAPPSATDAMATSGARLLSEFSLLRVIGRGSYAKVLQVQLKRTKQIYAMKVIKKEMFIQDEDIDWVQTEKSVFETASNHPFLVGLHSCFQSPSRLFFIIEFMPGGDLMFLMQQKRQLPEDHARFYAAEVVLALNFLHSRRIIYRDLKLDNVLLDMDGHIKLTDYGMCKENIGPGDVTETFCGTPTYIAPEILRGAKYGYSVDWWALGVLMFEMMAGKSPFDYVPNVNDANQQEAMSEDYLFEIILSRPIRIPRSLSVKANSVLRGFLNKAPHLRLGCVGKTIELNLDEIKHNPFFKNVEWELLAERGVEPPYKPPIKDELDLENFDTAFTNEPVALTPDDPKVLSQIDQSEFEGFEYVNPLLMSNEDSV